MHQHRSRSTSRGRSAASPQRAASPRRPGSGASSAHALLELQRTAGNQAVVSLLTAPEVGARLPVQRGLWDRIKKGAKAVGGAVASGAKAVGGAVKTGAKAVAGAAKTGAKAVAGAVKTVAGKVVDAAGRVWNGVKWVAEQTWSKLEAVWLRVGQWVRKLPTRLGRLVSHIYDGVKSLDPTSLSWWKSLGEASTWKDFGRWLGTLVIYSLEVGGIGELYETAADFVKFNTRPLSGDEKAKGKRVYGGAIPWDLVRVDAAAVLGPAWSKREYVSFNTINGWATMDDHTLIHELAHVWQYNSMGAVYMPKAIHAQVWGKGYDYGGITELQKRQAAGQSITSFNPEQQGQILGDYYVLALASANPDPAAVATYEHFVRGVRR